MRAFKLLAASSVLMLGGIACSGTDDGGAITPPASTPSDTADIQGTAANRWSPGTFEASVGDTVTWTWSGSHSVVANDDSFTSGEPENGGSFEHTFDAAGTFAYVCGVHGSTMPGNIVVS